MKTATNTDARTFPMEGLAKVTEAADFLSVGRTTIYAMLKDGDLKAVMVRGDARIPWASLHAFASVK